MPKCPFCKVHTDTGSDLQDHLEDKHPNETIDYEAQRRDQQKRIVKKRKRPLVIDGDSIAKLEDGVKVSLIKKARTYLVKLGFQPLIFMSAATGAEADNEMEYNRIKNLKWITEAEELIPAMAAMARKKKCMILTNEEYTTAEADTNDWKLSDNLISFSYDNATFAINTE